MSEEVRYQMLRPAQVVARRKACPVAYVPLGNLEWHGVHNALGADTLQAEGLAILCAQLGGGLAMPPLYYGESRAEGLMESGAGDRQQIAEAMEIPPEHFQPERLPFSASEQALNYQRLLLHILAELDTLGFKVGVLLAGHYPLIDHAAAAVLLHNRRHVVTKQGGMLAWAVTDYRIVRDKYPQSGDHAGLWETSHMMHLYPDTVDLSALGPRGQQDIGVGGKDPRDATAEFGGQTLRASAEAIAREATDRLANRNRYLDCGASLCEGLWRQPEAR